MWPCYVKLVSMALVTLTVYGPFGSRTFPVAEWAYLAPMAHRSQMDPMAPMVLHGDYSFGGLYVANGLDGSHGSSDFHRLNGSFCACNDDGLNGSWILWLQWSNEFDNYSALGRLHLLWLL